MDNLQRTTMIDAEFKALIPPLSDDERRQLEANLQRDGCRDPIVVWKDHGVILDGHNRFAICQRLGLPFATVEQMCVDRDAAMIWIIHNQFGRRNLTPFARAELALKLEPLFAARAKARQGTRTDLRQNSAEGSPVETREAIARMADVSHDTITKTKKILAKAPEAVKAKLRNGETTINREYTALVKVDPPPPSTYEWRDNTLTALRKERADLVTRFEALVRDYEALDATEPLDAAERRTIRVDFQKIRRRFDDAVAHFEAPSARRVARVTAHPNTEDVLDTGGVQRRLQADGLSA